jgi:hypothetical protein
VVALGPVMGPKAGKEKRKRKKEKIIIIIFYFFIFFLFYYYFILNLDCPHRCEVVPGNPLAAERVV